MKFSDAIKLLTRLPRNPRGVYDELKVRWELYGEHSRVPPPSYQPVEFEDLVSGIEQSLNIDLRKFLAEPELVEIENQVKQNMERIKPEAPFSLLHNGDLRFARFCYAICRAVKPAVTVKTGVAYGVSSAFILKALKINGSGKLFSVDRAPIERDADRFIGAFIPEELKENWHLRRGASSEILPELLNDLGKVDIFLHDSRHTYANMKMEFETVAPYLGGKSVLIADDVNRNIAFQEWATQANPAFWATTFEQSKESLFGVGVFLEKPQRAAR